MSRERCDAVRPGRDGTGSGSSFSRPSSQRTLLAKPTCNLEVAFHCASSALVSDVAGLSSSSLSWAAQTSVGSLMGMFDSAVLLNNLGALCLTERQINAHLQAAACPKTARQTLTVTATTKPFLQHGTDNLRILAGSGWWC